MKCPYCGYSESKVIDSRPSDEGASIRRRRECLSCSKRFTTYETVESMPMVVVKKDGSRQSFDRRKVLGGMIRACEKRPVAWRSWRRLLRRSNRICRIPWIGRFPPMPSAKRSWIACVPSIRWPMSALLRCIVSLRILIPLWQN